MLPESLATIPNIPWQSQTIEQLKAERDYWNSKIKSADGWGASVGAAIKFRDACTREIQRRELDEDVN
jgi:hypothetical protein